MPDRKGVGRTGAPIQGARRAVLSCVCRCYTKSAAAEAYDNGTALVSLPGSACDAAVRGIGSTACAGRRSDGFPSALTCCEYVASEGFDDRLDMRPVCIPCLRLRDFVPWLAGTVRFKKVFALQSKHGMLSVSNGGRVIPVSCKESGGGHALKSDQRCCNSAKNRLCTHICWLGEVTLCAIKCRTTCRARLFDHSVSLWSMICQPPQSG